MQLLKGPSRPVTVWVMANGHLPLVVLQRYFSGAVAVHYKSFGGDLVTVAKFTTKSGEVVFWLPREDIQYLVSLVEDTVPILHMREGFLRFCSEMNNLRTEMNFVLKEMDVMAQRLKEVMLFTGETAAREKKPNQGNSGTRLTDQAENNPDKEHTRSQCSGGLTSTLQRNLGSKGRSASSLVTQTEQIWCRQRCEERIQGVRNRRKAAPEDGAGTMARDLARTGAEGRMSC